MLCGPVFGGARATLTSWGSRCGQPANRRICGSRLVARGSKQSVGSLYLQLLHGLAGPHENQVGFDSDIPAVVKCRELALCSVQPGGGWRDLRIVVLLLLSWSYGQGTGWVVERAWDINCVELWTRRPSCADRGTGGLRSGLETLLDLGRCQSRPARQTEREKQAGRARTAASGRGSARLETLGVRCVARGGAHLGGCWL